MLGNSRAINKRLLDKDSKNMGIILVFLIEYAHRISHSGTNVTTEMTFIALNTYL